MDGMAYGADIAQCVMLCDHTPTLCSLLCYAIVYQSADWRYRKGWMEQQRRRDIQSNLNKDNGTASLMMDHCYSTRRASCRGLERKRDTRH